MNIDKPYMFDERPGFESYNMVNFPYPSMPMMYPINTGYQNTSSCNNNSNNNIENRISKLENQIDNLQNRVSRLEGSMYPQAVDYNTYPKATYQNSMNY